MTESDTPISAINAHVEQVAALLPFPVELDADMGGTFALQIDLGQRGGVDDPHDTAGIDPDNPRWWIDIEGGEKTYISDYSLDDEPATVAAWIAHVARAEKCPASVFGSDQRVRSIVNASFSTAATQAQASPPIAHVSAPSPDRGVAHER